MAGGFAIILTLATLITGIIWCLEKFKWQPARQRLVEKVRVEAGDNVDCKVLASIGKPKSWVEFFAPFFPILFVVFVIRSFIYEPFQIPSGSMMPTLLVGDFIAVQKFSYGIKDPITNSTIIATGHPQRGDVAVFKHPDHLSMDMVKRVVGVPGDKIVYLVDEKKLQIYPVCQVEDTHCQGNQTQPLDLNYSKTEKSDWVEVFNQTGANFYTQEQYKDLSLPIDGSVLAFALNQRTEMLGEQPHTILTLPMTVHTASSFYKQNGQKIGEWIVPEGYYFMMGDNRDNSDDSRFWGFVKEELFVGKATTIWLSVEKQPNEWPTGIRFSRIGGIH